MEGFDNLGWYWWAQSQALLSQDYKGRPACVNRGFCAFGCPSGALALPSNTYWPEALAAGARLHTRARVREITVDAKGKAAGALYYDSEGRLRAATASIVVMCGNGVGTPRLLFMSKSNRFPDGLANTSGQVGRNFMPHVQTMVIGHFDEPTDADHGAWGGTVSSRHFYETDPDNDYVRGFTMVAMRGYSPLNTALAVAPWGESITVRWSTTSTTRRRCGCAATMPPRSTTGSNWTRSTWMPRTAGCPNVLHALRELPTAGRRRSQPCDRTLRLGRRRLRTTPGFDSILGWHLLGTARNGFRSENSVVDANNRAHDVPNLYVVDGSSFATGGAVNPTHTIQALALRAADAIWEARHG